MNVPNRGGRITITAIAQSARRRVEQRLQGDNAGATGGSGQLPRTSALHFRTNEWVKVPVVTGVTGRIFGRIINRSGLGAHRERMGNPIPYFPLCGGQFRRDADHAYA